MDTPIFDRLAKELGYEKMIEPSISKPPVFNCVFAKPASEALEYPEDDVVLVRPISVTTLADQSRDLPQE